MMSNRKGVVHHEHIGRIHALSGSFTVVVSRQAWLNETLTAVVERRLQGVDIELRFGDTDKTVRLDVERAKLLAVCLTQAAEAAEAVPDLAEPIPEWERDLLEKT